MKSNNNQICNHNTQSHRSNPRNLNANIERGKMKADLFPGKLRCVREDEIDGELRRNRRSNRRTWLHEGRRSLRRVHVRRYFLPWLHESRIDRRRKLRWKGTSSHRFGGCCGDGSGDEAGSLSQHGGDLESREYLQMRRDERESRSLRFFKNKNAVSLRFTRFGCARVFSFGPHKLGRPRQLGPLITHLLSQSCGWHWPFYCVDGKSINFWSCRFSDHSVDGQISF